MMKRISAMLLAASIGMALTQPVSAAGAAGQWNEQVLYTFQGGSDGATPRAGLIDVQGTLYGTTSVGGGNGCSGYGCGTVYSLNLSTGAESVVYAFCSQPNCADGAGPLSTLIDINGTLYGTTANGGANCTGTNGCGTLFAVDATTGAEKVLYLFCSQTDCKDGKYPYAGLIDVNGTLYGTTQEGGIGYGTVYSFDLKTGKEKVVYPFGGGTTDGAHPESVLIDVNGTLYGTTFGGGNETCLADAGCGTAFAFDPKSGAETVLYDFCSQAHCADGEFPAGSLIDFEGTLYGTTAWGGTGGGCNAGCGAVFSLDPKSDAEKVIHSFCRCADGLSPAAGLLEAKGILYGTTYAGGGGADCHLSTGCGAAYSLDPHTGKEKVIYGFCSQTNCTDGSYPQSSLIDVRGTLYGTASSGGTSGDGIVFALKKP